MLVDGDDKDKKNFSGIQFNRFNFLYTQFSSVYLDTARHPSVNPALVQLALRPNSTNQCTKPGLEFLGPALYPTIWF